MVGHCYIKWELLPRCWEANLYYWQTFDCDKIKSWWVWIRHDCCMGSSHVDRNQNQVQGVVYLKEYHGHSHHKSGLWQVILVVMGLVELLHTIDKRMMYSVKFRITIWTIPTWGLCTLWWSLIITAIVRMLHWTTQWWRRAGFWMGQVLAAIAKDSVHNRIHHLPIHTSRVGNNCHNCCYSYCSCTHSQTKLD